MKSISRSLLLGLLVFASSASAQVNINAPAAPRAVTSTDKVLVKLDGDARGYLIPISGLPTFVLPAFSGDCTTVTGGTAITCARSNGVLFGAAAFLDVGTASGTVAAGNDSRLSNQRVPTDGSVTTAKLGGDITAAGKALLDDADSAAQRTTLGLGTAATQATGAFEAAGAVSTHSAATSGVHGISSYGATLVDDTSASAARTTLGLDVLATTVPGTGIATFLATPSSANFAAALTNETGTAGSVVLSVSPALTGTPTTPTASTGTSTTQIASTAFVGAQIASSAVTSVSAANGSVAIGGTANAPTVAATGQFSGSFIGTTAAQTTDTFDDGLYIPHATGGVTTYDWLTRRAGGGWYLRQNASAVPTGSGDYASGSIANLDATFSTNGVSIQPQSQMNVYATAGTFTWTKQAWARTVQVTCIGGGGGGASGAVEPSGSASSAGTGGNAGVLNYSQFLAADLTSTVTVTVGAASAGGTAISSNATGGNAGTAGANATFGGYLTGFGGNGGNAGSTTVAATPASQAANATFANANVTGAASITAGASSPASSGPSAGPGGTGGSISTASALLNPSAGATGYAQGGATYRSTGGAAGISGTVPGSNGATTTAVNYGFGAGGGGGYPTTSGAAGAGGDGGNPGGGGGGGAATQNGGTSGAGGAGGLGGCRVLQQS